MTARSFIVAAGLFIWTGCAGPAIHLELPTNHPANPSAPAADSPTLSQTLTLTTPVETTAPAADMPVSPEMREHAESRAEHNHVHHGSTGQQLHQDDATTPAPPQAENDVVYVCPMHRTVVSPDPGRCPVCRMQLVARSAEGGRP
jgi:hypothetical protein